jgi:hypothetical protein
VLALTGTVQDPVVLLQLLRCIKGLAPLLRLAPGSLIQTYQCLFQHMGYGDDVTASQFTSEKSWGVFSENANQVKKMAATVIAHMSTHTSETLLATNMMDQFCSSTMAALG